MKAVVFHGVGDIRLDDVDEPRLRDQFDAIVRITSSAICGTDLHMVRGTLPGMEPGTILGHEAVGVVEDVGSQVRNVQPGDRVIIPSTIGCGSCSYCRCGYYAQCDTANPNGPRAGTAYFGGPKQSGPFHGLQAEYARVPFANVGPVKIPDQVSDEQAVLLSDMFPTGYFGARLAEIRNGDTVAVFGCGTVGMFAILSAMLLGAGRVIAVDHVRTRLEKARELGAEVVNFDEEDPVEAILSLTGGIGVDRAIDAVGVDAEQPKNGPLAGSGNGKFRSQLEQISPDLVRGGNGKWHPGDAPSQALEWAVDAVAKAGTISIIGVYPPQLQVFPIGKVMNKNLSILSGSCNHRKYIPYLLSLVKSGQVDPTRVVTQDRPLKSAIEAYKSFDSHSPGWLKVLLEPESLSR